MLNHLMLMFMQKDTATRAPNRPLGFLNAGSLIRQVETADRLMKNGQPLAALNVLLPRYSEDYPWGGLVEPYDAIMEAELINQ